MIIFYFYFYFFSTVAIENWEEVALVSSEITKIWLSRSEKPVLHFHTIQNQGCLYTSMSLQTQEDNWRRPLLDRFPTEFRSKYTTYYYRRILCMKPVFVISNIGTVWWNLMIRNNFIIIPEQHARLTLVLSRMSKL